MNSTSYRFVIVVACFFGVIDLLVGKRQIEQDFESTFDLLIAVMTQFWFFFFNEGANSSFW